MLTLKIFEDWLKNKNLKPRSIKNYLYYYTRFKYPKFNQETVSLFLSESPHRNSIAKAFLVNMKECLLRNYKALNIDPDYYKEIVEVYLPKVSGRKHFKITEPLSPEQIERLEETLNNEQDKLLLNLNYYCGLRLQELMGLKIYSFNWETWKKNPELMGEIKVFGKGARERKGLVPAFLMKKVSQFIHNHTARFKGIDSPLFDISGRTWQQHLREAGIKSGITKFKEDGKTLQETHVFPHKMRHTYADYLLHTKNLDIRYVQEALGHVDISSTQRYTKVKIEQLREKLESPTND